MQIMSCVASQIENAVRRALISLSVLNIYNVASRESETHSLTKQQKKEITTFSKAYRALTRPAEEQKTKQLSQKLIGRSPVPPKNRKSKLSLMLLLPLISFSSLNATAYQDWCTQSGCSCTELASSGAIVSNGTTFYKIYGHVYSRYYNGSFNQNVVFDATNTNTLGGFGTISATNPFTVSNTFVLDFGSSTTYIVKRTLKLGS